MWSTISLDPPIGAQVYTGPPPVAGGEQFYLDPAGLPAWFFPIEMGRGVLVVDLCPRSAKTGLWQVETLVTGCG